MLDAWIAGDVPRDIMADWCEERGLPFPRSLPAVSRHRWRRPPISHGSSGAVVWDPIGYAVSRGRYRSLSGSRSGATTHARRGRVPLPIGRSTSGSRSSEPGEVEDLDSFG